MRPERKVSRKCKTSVRAVHKEPVHTGLTASRTPVGDVMAGILHTFANSAMRHAMVAQRRGTSRIGVLKRRCSRGRSSLSLAPEVPREVANVPRLAAVLAVSVPAGHGIDSEGEETGIDNII
jgi:hypothetical protein